MLLLNFLSHDFDLFVFIDLHSLLQPFENGNLHFPLLLDPLQFGLLVAADVRRYLLLIAFDFAVSIDQLLAQVVEARTVVALLVSYGDLLALQLSLLLLCVVNKRVKKLRDAVHFCDKATVFTLQACDLFVLMVDPSLQLLVLPREVYLSNFLGLQNLRLELFGLLLDKEICWVFKHVRVPSSTLFLLGAVSSVDASAGQVHVDLLDVGSLRSDDALE